MRFFWKKSTPIIIDYLVVFPSGLWGILPMTFKSREFIKNNHPESDIKIKMSIYGGKDDIKDLDPMLHRNSIAVVALMMEYPKIEKNISKIVRLKGI